MSVTDYADWAPAVQAKRAHQLLASTGPQTIVVGTPQFFPVPPQVFSGTGYDIFVNCFAPGGAVNAILQLDVNWSDSASGVSVDQQTYYAWAGTSSNLNPHIWRVNGPTEGDQVQLKASAITNNVGLVGIIFMESSTAYAQHHAISQQFTAQGSAVLAANDPAAGFVGARNVPALGAGLTDTTDLSLYSGRVWVRANTASGTSDLTLRINAATETVAIPTPDVVRARSDSAGLIELYAQLPRAQCQLILTNGNAGPQAVGATIIQAPEG